MTRSDLPITRKTQPPLFYQQNLTPRLDLELFKHPSAEYRGAPFWAWNTRLERAPLLHQIEVFKQMGMGGFHIHPRTGLNTPYLSDEFMTHVKACVEKARQDDLRVWLYDEDRWPSGAAGGLVTQDERFRARHLLWTCVPYDGTPGQGSLDASARATRSGQGELLACYVVQLEGGRLGHYRRLGLGEVGEIQPGERLWYAYLETSLPSPWFNDQTYLDTLNPQAVARFLEVTHERYAEVVGEHFGITILAMFTDEPQFPHKQCFGRADELRDLILPWTPDFFETYRHTYGTSLEDTLPELFWERSPGQVSRSRYRYHDHLAERFTSAYADQVGTWCGEHGLMLTGHMMEEPTLESQSAALGEAMRSYRSFHLPGVDMLCDAHEYNTVKQASSAARQYGRPGVLSELYGVTNWDFDFRGHKAQGDWQAALGVTVRVPHLAWVSMAGEAKRDFPAPIGPQSPWHLEYPLVENHFARLNTVLTRGQALARVAVIHPVESFWLYYGPLEHTRPERDTLERHFSELTEWLLFGTQDFDFIAESLFPELCIHPEWVPLEVGQSRYDVVLVPGLKTVRSSTLERLERFRDAGGTLIFLGQVPDLVDAEASDRAQVLALRCSCVPFEHQAVLKALQPWREVELSLKDGSPAQHLLHQVRADGEARHVFICNTHRTNGYSQTRIKFTGTWRVQKLDTFTGTVESLAARVELGNWGEVTVLEHDFEAHDHLLLILEPGIPRADMPVKRTLLREYSRLNDPVPVTLSEPNVLLLDRAEYRLEGEEWQNEDEILRLDTHLRERLGWDKRMDALAQPWTRPVTAAPHTLHLRFTLHLDVAVSGASLALEDAAHNEIYLNTTRVRSTVTGTWVDDALQTVALPDLEAGVHTLELTLPYAPHSHPEWCYLLGDFGVEVRGRHAKLVAPVRQLAWGDWTHQGLPFYAGNVTYHCTLENPQLEGSAKPSVLEVAHFRAPLLTVQQNGLNLGVVAFAPYQLDLGVLTQAEHRLDLTAFGSRVNAFGAVHNADSQNRWFGPNAWRSADLAWADEYQLKPTGILVAPRILRP